MRSVLLCAVVLSTSTACGLLGAGAGTPGPAEVDGGLSVVPDGRPFDPSLVVDESDEGATANEHVTTEAQAASREQRDESVVERIDEGAGDDEGAKVRVASNPPARVTGSGDAWPTALLDAMMEVLLVLALSLLIALPVWGLLAGGRRAVAGIGRATGRARRPSGVAGASPPDATHPG